MNPRNFFQPFAANISIGGFPWELITRIWQICSSDASFKEQSKILKYFFCNRGYESHITNLHLMGVAM